MKTIFLSIIEGIILLVGIWIFLLNVLTRGNDEQLLAGLGGALIFLYILINEYWVKPKEIEKPNASSNIEDSCYW